MLVLELKGGLANQMFQWAESINLSKINNTELFLDLSFFENRHNDTPRVFSLDKFPNLNYIVFDSQIPTNKLIINDEFDLNNRIDKSKDYLLCVNSFSERFFYDIQDFIRYSFSYNQNFIDKINQTKYRTVFTENTLSLHVRRTDYLNSNGFHLVLPVSYYLEAVEMIKDYDRIFIFSDDLEWCKQNLNFCNSEFVEDLSDIEDLWLMSLCNNNIISNSTFSWWAAWLNKNSEKVIVCPSRWFGENTGVNIEKLIPENWYKI